MAADNAMRTQLSINKKQVFGPNIMTLAITLITLVSTILKGAH